MTPRIYLPPIPKRKYFTANADLSNYDLRRTRHRLDRSTQYIDYFGPDVGKRLWCLVEKRKSGQERSAKNQGFRYPRREKACPRHRSKVHLFPIPMPIREQLIHVQFSDGVFWGFDFVAQCPVLITFTVLLMRKSSPVKDFMAGSPSEGKSACRVSWGINFLPREKRKLNVRFLSWNRDLKRGTMDVERNERYFQSLWGPCYEIHLVQCGTDTIIRGYILPFPSLILIFRTPGVYLNESFGAQPYHHEERV